MQMMMGEKFVCPLEQFGIYMTVTWDNILLIGLERITYHLRLCEGLQDEIDDGIRSKVPVKHYWKELLANGSVHEWEAWHSHRCQYILPLTGELKKKTCRQCIHNLR